MIFLALQVYFAICLFSLHYQLKNKEGHDDDNDKEEDDDDNDKEGQEEDGGDDNKEDEEDGRDNDKEEDDNYGSDANKEDEDDDDACSPLATFFRNHYHCIPTSYMHRSTLKASINLTR